MKLPYYFILQVSTLFNLYKLLLVGFNLKILIEGKIILKKVSNRLMPSNGSKP
jgi:hypothetical protein